MIWFFALAAIMALGTAWLLALPMVSSTDVSSRDRQRSLLAIGVMSVLFPFTLYCLVTF